MRVDAKCDAEIGVANVSRDVRRIMAKRAPKADVRVAEAVLRKVFALAFSGWNRHKAGGTKREGS